MSYINDALKKAQKESNVCITPYETVIADSLTFKKRTKGWSILLSGISMLLLFVILGSVFNFFDVNKITNINIYKENLKSFEKEKKLANKEEQNNNNNNEISTKIAETVVNKKNPEPKNYGKLAIKEKLEKKSRYNNSKNIENDQENKKTVYNIKEKETGDIEAIKEPVEKKDNLFVSLNESIHKKVQDKKKPDKKREKINKKAPSAEIFLQSSSLYEKGLDNQISLKYKAAIKYYEKCLKLDPDMAPAINNLGVIMMKKHKFEKAKAYFQAAIDKSPDYVDPYYNMACLYSQTYNFSMALDFLKKSIGISDQARVWAITDKDFKPLYELTEFNMIISGN